MAGSDAEDSADPGWIHPKAPDAQIPDFVEYTPSELHSYTFCAVLVLAAVAAVAAVAGWALASWTPPVVSIRDGVLEVARGSREEYFNLRDPETRVVLGKQPGSPSWRTTLARPDGHTTVIGTRHVKASHFTRIVQHHRSRLRSPETPAGNRSPGNREHAPERTRTSPGTVSAHAFRSLQQGPGSCRWVPPWHRWIKAEPEGL